MKPTINDRILTLLAKHPAGLTTEEVWRVLRTGDRALRNNLKELRSIGRIDGMRCVDGYNRWCLPKFAPAVRAAVEAERREAMRATHLRRLARKRTRWVARSKRLPTPEMMAEADTWPVVQRVLPASQAKPLPLPAVNSVWSLAA